MIKKQQQNKSSQQIEVAFINSIITTLCIEAHMSYKELNELSHLEILLFYLEYYNQQAKNILQIIKKSNK